MVVFDSPPDGLWVFTDPKLVVFSTDCCQRELSFELVRWRAAPGHLLSPATVGFPPAHLSAATTPASFDENTTRKAFAALPVWFTVDVGRDDRGSQARCRRDSQGEMAPFLNRILQHL